MAAGGSRGAIAERAYLGEHWEYVVRPAASELRLRVSTAPQAVYETGDAVWLEIDPRRIARVPNAETQDARRFAH